MADDTEEAPADDMDAKLARTVRLFIAEVTKEQQPEPAPAPAR